MAADGDLLEQRPNRLKRDVRERGQHAVHFAWAGYAALDPGWAGTTRAALTGSRRPSPTAMAGNDD